MRKIPEKNRATLSIWIEEPNMSVDVDDGRRVGRYFHGYEVVN